MPDQEISSTPAPQLAGQRLSKEALERNVVQNREEQRGKLATFLRFALGTLGTVIVAYFVILVVLFLLGWTAAPLFG